MARAVVRSADLEAGDVPAVSVKTGRACANPVAIALRPTSTAWSPGGRKIVAVVPLEPRRVREHRLLNRGGWIVLGGLVGSLFVIGALGPVPAAAFFVAYVALVVTGDRRWIGARLGARDGEVVLTRVHRAFARAVDEQYGASA